ncbi:MAG: S8/S53 family peptidase [Flavobacteriaceae bacterium]|nr:S8/S53 family peptidase [Flavobacteriaceae bacterium]
MILKYTLFFLFIIGMSFSSLSQNESWFYIRAKDTLFNPEFKKENNKLLYIGDDSKLKAVLDNFTIFEFKKTFRKAKKTNLKKTFFVVSNNDELLSHLLKSASHLFELGELIHEEDKKIFEPNDYGLTSTIGENTGIQVNLDYFDFIGLPEAWYYTTGSKDMIIGMSDASIDTTNLDFKDKTTVIRQSGLAGGHGITTTSLAAGQGNNGYGVLGACYDCSVYATTYGDFRNLDQLLELSHLGVKVINCSWVGSRYYQTAQDVINEMFNNGTVIVASAGNRDWSKAKGTKIYYPASYDHVIAVASVMHRHESVNDNILLSKKRNYYAANIKNYVGRTVGFKDKGTLKKQHIWPVSVTTLNKHVDILAPSVGLFRFAKFTLYGKTEYTAEASSSTSPFVTGTIGLMLSLYPCLPIDEVESILKTTATNIDGIYANKPYAGNYGAGSLNAGRAVKMIYNLYTEGETATIENQKFSRWDFKLTSLSEKVLIQNQEFTESSTLNLTAKNSIVIGENTVLKPNYEGSIILKIDPTLKKECDLVLREGFPNNKYYYPEK